MKRYNTVYYLLFVLLVTGSFASMAQNDYGVFIMGFVASGFGVLFLVQLFSRLSKAKTNEDKFLPAIELIGLSILTGILALRIFYIHFEFVEVLFVVAGIVLVVYYSIRLQKSWKELRKSSSGLGIRTSLFYGSIIFYLLSMISVPFWPFMAEPFGGLGFFLGLVFLAIGIQKIVTTEEGEKISAIDYVSKFRDRSVVLIFLFLLFTAYMGLTKIGVLPKMYSDEYPQAYFELVNRAESGQEDPENGKYKHQEFKEAYDTFIEKSDESE